MSIDRSGITPSRAAQDRISALSSVNQRLMAANKHADAFVKEQAERYAAELSEALDERNRARSMVAALEQEIAAIRSAAINEARVYETGSDTYWAVLRVLWEVLSITGDPALDAARDHGGKAMSKVVEDIIREAS